MRRIQYLAWDASGKLWSVNEVRAMNVEALDHINIITDRMDETARFYSGLLGLERRDAPPPLTPQNATWMFDAEGRAIIHINSTDCPRTFDRDRSCNASCNERSGPSTFLNSCIRSLNGSSWSSLFS